MERIKNIILKNKYLSWILIFTNWFFQGIHLGSRIEAIYKVLFTIFFWIVFILLFVLIFQVPFEYSILYAFLIAHTLNWLVNCNFFVIFIHRIKWIKIPTIKLFNYLYEIQSRLNNKHWLLYATSSGGISRGTMNHHSDIDISLVIKPGIVNAIKAILFFVKEKKRADFKGIPLDIFISETPQQSISRSNGQENPVIIADAHDTISDFYKQKMTIEEAQELNGALE